MPKTGKQKYTNFKSKPNMGKPTDANFDSNLALVVSSHPVKFQVDRTKRLWVRVRKPKYLGWVQAQIDQRTNSNFKSSQALVVSYHPVKFHIDQTKRFQVRVSEQNLKIAAIEAILFFQMAPTLKAS